MPRAGADHSVIVQLIDLADVLRGVHQLEGDPLAMATCREAAAFNNRDLVRHVRVMRIVADAVDAGFGDDLTRLEYLSHWVCSVEFAYPGNGQPFCHVPVAD